MAYEYSSEGSEPLDYWPQDQPEKSDVVVAHAETH